MSFFHLFIILLFFPEKQIIQFNSIQSINGQLRISSEKQQNISSSYLIILFSYSADTQHDSFSFNQNKQCKTVHYSWRSFHGHFSKKKSNVFYVVIYWDLWEKEGIIYLYLEENQW